MPSPIAIFPPSAWSDAAVNELRAEMRAIAKRLNGRDEGCLRFVTITIAAYPSDLRQDRSPVIDKARKALAAFKADLLAAMKADGKGSTDTKLSRCGSLWIGAVECDLIDHSDYLSPAKRELLVGLGIEDDSCFYDFGLPDPNKAIAVFHVHLIINWRGLPSFYAFDKTLRDTFPGNRRVHIAELWDTKSTALNLHDICGYSTKFLWRHSQTVETKTGVKTKLTRAFHPSWEHWLKHFYLGIDLDHFLVQNMPEPDRRTRRPDMASDNHSDEISAISMVCKDVISGDYPLAVVERSEEKSFCAAKPGHLINTDRPSLADIMAKAKRRSNI